MDAEALTPLSQTILEGLIEARVKVVSYACDGTEVERAVQRLLSERAERHITYAIEDPHHAESNVSLKIPVIKGQPVCMIQDSKHALKSLRNGLFSGGRALALGNFIAMYAHIRQMAFEDKAPVYKRDVEKLDRQDDNAASRLFSSKTLQYLCENHPEHVGDIVYLFVFGELIDAYQNRSIPHSERVKLVLRARYFLDNWLKSLEVSGYSKTLYAISREGIDIMRIIIDGYLSLLIVHRDHIDGIAPLLPWLHSSEACEHVFGEARQIVKDFTMLDLLYMIPKLRVKMRHAILDTQLSDPKARASGYSHTYFDLAGLNELNLATFPSDFDIRVQSENAAAESDCLLRLLGIRPQRLRRKANAKVTELPGIDSWFCEDDSTSINSDATGSSQESLSEAQEFHDIFAHEENLALSRTEKQERALLNLKCAELGLKVDDYTNVYVSGYVLGLKIY